MKPILTVDIGGCFAFSPDSSRIAVAKKSVGKKMGQVVDIATGNEVVSIDRLPANTRKIAYSPSGRFLVFGSMYEGITACDPSTGARLQRVSISTGEIRDLAFAPDDTDTLIHVTWDQVTEVEVASGQIGRTFPVGKASGDFKPMYETANFSSRGDRVAISWRAGMEPTVFSIVEWKSGLSLPDQATVELDGLTGLHEARMAPGDDGFLLADFSGRVYYVPLNHHVPAASPIIDRSTPEPGFGELGMAIGGLGTSAGKVEFSPTGNVLVFGHDGIFEIWSWPDPKHLGEWQLPGKTPSVFEVGFSPNGEYLGVALDRSTVIYRVSDLI